MGAVRKKFPALRRSRGREGAKAIVVKIEVADLLGLDAGVQQVAYLLE